MKDQGRSLVLAALVLAIALATVIVGKLVFRSPPREIQYQEMQKG